MHNISKKTCFPSTRKVLDFDLNGQHMRNTEVSEGNWVLGCSPDHSTIRPKIQWFSFACGVVFFADIQHFRHIFCPGLSEKPNFR